MARTVLRIEADMEPWRDAFAELVEASRTVALPAHLTARIWRWLDHPSDAIHFDEPIVEGDALIVRARPNGEFLAVLATARALVAAAGHPPFGA